MLLTVLLLHYIIFQILVVTYGASSKHICNSDNYPRIYPFVNRRWHDARQELQLPNLTKCTHKERSCEHYSTMNRFFKFISKHNASVWYRNGTLVCYVRIYKCANTDTVSNLNNLDRQIGNFVRKNEYFSITRENAIILKHAIKYYDQDNITATWGNSRLLNFTTEFRTRNSDFKIFTFIREPLTHFESGFAEAIYRTTARSLMLNSSDDIRDILKGFLSNDRSIPIKDIFHIFPQSGVFFNFDIDIT